MGTPDFIVELRRHVGHAPLWLTGATAVVVREAGAEAVSAGADTPAGTTADHATPDADPGREVLLVRRADDGRWTPVTGIVDPGEEVADTAVREVLEETAVRARAERLVRVATSRPITYPNGDQAQYVDLVFRCAWVSGEPYPADGENSETRWFDLDALPPMSEEMLERIDAALDLTGPARFTGGAAPDVP